MSESAVPSTSKGHHAPIISGLPDDIAILCLAWVPREYHCILRCVSKRWKSLFASIEFQHCRKAHNMQETWVYAICRRHIVGKTFYYALNPFSSTRSWMNIECVPPQCCTREGMSFETVGNKLFVLGGCSWREDATDEVFYYDAYTNAWGQAASMPTPRSYFLSAVLANMIYVTNEATMSATGLQTWDVYDANLDIWTESHNQNLPSDVHQLVPLDGRIYTIHEPCPNEFCQGILSTLLGDDEEHMEGPDLVAFWHCPMILVDGDLYMLDQTCGVKLMMWHKETRDWALVGRLSSWLIKPPCQLAACGRTIIVVGRGLTTAAFDLDWAGKVTGTMVSSFSLPEADPALSVLGCKTITL